MRKITVDNYKELTMDEINSIIRRGGDAKKQLNKAVMDYLDTLDLSDKARSVINDTDPVCECFAGMYTAEEIEAYVNEYDDEEE